MQIKISSKYELDVLKTMLDFIYDKQAFLFAILEKDTGIDYEEPYFIEIFFSVLTVADNKLFYLFKKENKVYMSKTVSYKCDIIISSDAAPKLIEIWNDMCQTCKKNDFMIVSKLASET